MGRTRGKKTPELERSRRRLQLLNHDSSEGRRESLVGGTEGVTCVQQWKEMGEGTIGPAKVKKRLVMSPPEVLPATPPNVDRRRRERGGSQWGG